MSFNAARLHCPAGQRKPSRGVSTWVIMWQPPARPDLTIYHLLAIFLVDTLLLLLVGGSPPQKLVILTVNPTNSLEAFYLASIQWPLEAWRDLVTSLFQLFIVYILSHDLVLKKNHSFLPLIGCNE